MTSPLRWIHAERGVREAVDAWWGAGPTQHAEHTALATGAHRAVIRLDGASIPMLVKHYRPGSGVRRLRDRARTLFGFGAAQREWRGFALLAHVGVPAPRALGLAHSPAGDALLISESLAGQTLWDRLEAHTPGRRALLEAVADLVAQLHRAGLAHGDLHPGNILIGSAGPLLLDLQRTARARPGGSRQLDDLGLLDYSLRQFDASRSDRLRVLCRALSLDDASRSARRQALSRAIRAAERVSRRQSRTRLHHGREPLFGSDDWKR